MGSEYREGMTNTKTELKDRYLIRVPGHGYVVSFGPHLGVKFSYDERQAWSTDYTTEGWRIAHDVWETVHEQFNAAYVCERKVRY